MPNRIEDYRQLELLFSRLTATPSQAERRFQDSVLKYALSLQNLEFPITESQGCSVFYALLDDEREDNNPHTPTNI